MKKLMITAAVFATAFTLNSCGGKTEELKEEEVAKPSNPLEALANMSEETNEAQAAADKKIAERRAKGDTLAMPYEELMKYLPESIDGYKRQEPDGESVNMTGMSFSSANVDFENEKGERISVKIVDYNQAYGLYTTATAMWALGMSIDSPEEKAQGVKFEDDIAGWESIRKKSGDATVTLGVGYRFWVEVQADGQKDCENVKSIAKKIDLKKLASL